MTNDEVLLRGAPTSGQARPGPKPLGLAAVARSLPEHPGGVPLSAARWERVTTAMAPEQPVLAELSFFSLACWRGAEAVRLSRIGDVLVVSMADRRGLTMLVADPGTTVTAAEREAIGELARSRDVRYLSEPTARALAADLRSAGLRTEPVADDADYVYEMSRLATLDGADLRSKRRAVRRFTARHDAGVREGRLGDDWAFEHLRLAYDRWLAVKYPDPAGTPDAVRWERRAVEAWPRDRRADDVRVFCLTVDGAPAGFSTVEPMWDATWMGLVMKADPSLAGATAFLRQQVARAGLRELGDRGRLNIQQDEGLPGLRHAKQSYRPIRLEPKLRLIPIAEPTSKERPSC